jgi:phage tail sheath gpL-like
MSSPNITFTKITDTYVPGIQSEINVENALQSLPINKPKVAIIAQATSAGTATANTPVACFSEEEAITQSGQGSIGHLAIRAALKANPNMDLYNVPVDDGAGTQAAGTITVTTTCDATGFFEFWIGNEYVQVTVTDGDVVNDIAAAIDTAINEKEHNMPVTAGVSTNVVTLTARNDGLLGNNIPISYKNRGVGSTTLAVVQPTGGATDPDITTALANLETDNYDIILVTNNDATNLALLKTHLTSMAHPDANNPGIGVFGYTGVQATFQTLTGTTMDHERILGAYLKYSKTSERGHSLDYELGAAVAARIASRSDPSRSFDNEPLLGIAAPDKAQRLTRAQKYAIIDDGGAPCHAMAGEVVGIVRAVSCRITNANSVPDKALIDITTIRSLDYGQKYIEQRESSTFFQAKKTERTKLKLKSLVLDCLRILSLAEIWNMPADTNEVLVEDDLSNVYQLNVKIPAYVVPGLHNIANLINLYLR